MSEILTRDVPSHYIVLLFTIGFISLLLFPITLFPEIFPKWLNPLVQTNASDAIASVGLLTVFSIVLGIPGLILRDYITGNHNWLRKFKRKKSERYKVTEPSIKDVIRLSEKLDKYPALGRAISFLSVQYQLVNGIIVASEIALAINALIGGIILIISFTPPTLSPNLMYIYQRLFISLDFFAVSWAFDKWIFKKYLKKRTDIISARLGTLSAYEERTQDCEIDEYYKNLKNRQ